MTCLLLLLTLLPFLVLGITTAWYPNGQTIAQVDTIAITGVATGGTINFQINGKLIVYTCTATDTTTTAATNALALLTATQSSGPAEFAELVFTNPSSAVILATGGTPGQPFTLSAFGGAGATLTQTHTTPNSSPSDIANPNNWLRGQFPGLPQSGDDIVIAATSVPLLWNLNALQAINPNSVTRWQNFTGTIGLPLTNANGYPEYRPTDLTFGVSSGSSSSAAPGTVCQVLLGQGQTGTGPTRERYNFGSLQCAFNVLAAGSPQDDYAVHLLGTNALNTLNVQGCSVGVAMTAGQLSSILTGNVDGGGSLSARVGVSFLGTLTFNNGSGGLIDCVPQSLLLLNGSTCVVGCATGATYPFVQASQGSNLSWLSNCNISSLVLQTSSLFDKSGDWRPIVVGNATIDGDTCTVNDPLNAIKYTNAPLVNNFVSAGPFVLVGPRHLWPQ